MRLPIDGGILTSWVQVRHEIDIEVSHLVGKLVLDRIRHGAEEQIKFGSVENCERRKSFVNDS